MPETHDEQDQAEVFDEDSVNLDEPGAPPTEMRTFEELPDVLDVTSAEGDEDDDEALIAEELDDDEIIALEADQAPADYEDDDLARRDPEALRSAAEEAEPGDETSTDEALAELCRTGRILP